MKLFDKDLESEFINLGFANYRRMQKNAERQANFIYMKTKEQVLHPTKKTIHKIKFHFMIQCPSENNPKHIIYMTAGVVNEVNERLPIIHIQHYWPDYGSFPTKDQCVTQIFETTKIQNAKNKFNFQKIFIDPM